MSLPKISSKILLTIFLIFTNFWIYRILKEDLVIGLIIIVTSASVVWFSDHKKFLLIFTVGILALTILQFQTTQLQSLTLLDNDQQRIQQERIRSYPPTYINLYFKVVWLNPGEWIENNKILVALSVIEKNLFETLDINKYFFGGAPRNKPSDFEKFPLFLLPFFIAGVIKFVKTKRFKLIAALLILPLTILSYIGSKNNLGPFLLYPFFIISFISGINLFAQMLKRKKAFYILMVVLISLGFLIQISYAKI